MKPSAALWPKSNNNFLVKNLLFPNRRRSCGGDGGIIVAIIDEKLTGEDHCLVVLP